MAAARYWRVLFTPQGRVADVLPIRFDDGADDWTIVEATTAEEARKKGKRLYDARKKKLAKVRLQSEGRCACGRARDRKHSNGSPMLTCSTCAERQKGYNEDYEKRIVAGTVHLHERDETARVASNLARQRNRRAEIRLETLVEARRMWMEARNVGLYAEWLGREIAKLTGRQTAA